MKVAIIGKFNFHLECIGFILEIFKYDIVDIYLGIDTDKFGWIDYYKTIFSNISIYYSDTFSIDIINNYDKIFKLSSNDSCLNNENIISILHLIQSGWMNYKSKNFICLTPVINGQNIFYTFPTFNPIVNYKPNNIITLIGYCLPTMFDEDTISFINNNNTFEFHFVIKSNPLKLKNIKNVVVHTVMNTIQMTELINSSKYLLSKKLINYDRFSGALGLAISYEKPLIIDKKTKDIYGFPGIEFEKNYSEINLNNITDEEYIEQINKLQVFKKKQVENNWKILRDKL